MRAVDELLFRYPNAAAPWRRWALATLEDLEPQGDVFQRLKFLAQQALEGSDLIAHQALVGFASLLPARRMAGWSSDPRPVAGLPVLEVSDLTGLKELPPLHLYAVGVCASGELGKRLLRAIGKSSNTFPLALGMAGRPGTHGALLDWSLSFAPAVPEAALLAALIPGKRVMESHVSPGAAGPADLRISLIRALPHHPERDWSAPLKSLLLAPDPWVEVHALACLGRVGSPKAGVALLDLAPRITSEEARIQALRSCALIGGLAVMECAFHLLEGGSVEVQAAGLEALVSRGFLDARLDRAADKLRESQHPLVRALALAVLVRAGVARRWDELETLARSTDASDRTAAALALTHLGDGRSQQLLETIASEDTSRTVASTAVRGLYRARGSLAVVALRKALERGGIVARAAAEVLVWRALSTPGEVLEILGPEPAAGPGMLALGVAVAATGAREGVGLIASMLKQEDPDTVGWAAEACYPLGRAAPKKRLAACLKSKVASLRVRAAVALVLAGDRTGLDELKSLCRTAGFTTVALRGLLDLAAIIPNVHGRPLFASALKLIPTDVPFAAGDTSVDEESTSSETIADYPSRVRLPALNLEVITGRYDKLIVKEALAEPAPAAAPSRPAPKHAYPAAAPAPEDLGASLGGGGVPLTRMRELAAQSRPTPAPPPRPAAKSVPAPAPSVAPSPDPRDAVSMIFRKGGAPPRSSRLILVAAGAAVVVSGILGGVTFRQPQWSDGPPVAVAVKPLPELTFFPFAVVGARFARGPAAPVDMSVNDAFLAGDTLEVSTPGSAQLSTAKGSRLSLGERSGVRYVGPTTGARTYVLDHARGRVELTWKEAHALRIELATGALEAEAPVTVKLEEGHAEVKSGRAKWTRTGGPVEEVGAGAMVGGG